MFNIGDIIRHRRTGIFYLVHEKEVYFVNGIERVKYVAVSMVDGAKEILHYPLMTLNYEKIG